MHEHLKGSGPTALLVVVRGGHEYSTEAEARVYADYQVQARVTIWDARQAVLFLEAPARPYTPAGGGGAAGSSETTSPAVLQFTRLNLNQPPWAYSVLTLSRAWLPAQDTPAQGEAPTAFITDGTQSPPPTITLADLRARIAALAAELKAGDGIEGYAACIYGRILRERYRRADPWTPLQESVAMGSGSAAGTEVSRGTNAYRDPQYSRYWLSGSDSGRFRPLVIDADGVPSTGYDHSLATTRPLPSGTYHVRYNWQHPSDFPVALRRTIPTTTSPSRSRRRRGRCTRRSSIRRRWAAAWSGGTRPRGCWRRRPWARPQVPRAPRGVPRPARQPAPSAG